MKRSSKGFTLIELLLVIGIIAILASIVIVAINPTKQMGNARDAQRRSDVNTILNAVYQYSIDHNGSMPSTIPVISEQICNTTPGCTAPMVNLNALTGSYLVNLPSDPSRGSTATNTHGTYYFIMQDASTHRVTVTASGTEQIPGGISVTR